MTTTGGAGRRACSPKAPLAHRWRHRSSRRSGWRLSELAGCMRACGPLPWVKPWCRTSRSLSTNGYSVVGASCRPAIGCNMVGLLFLGGIGKSSTLTTRSRWRSSGMHAAMRMRQRRRRSSKMQGMPTWKRVSSVMPGKKYAEPDLQRFGVPGRWAESAYAERSGKSGSGVGSFCGSHCSWPVFGPRAETAGGALGPPSPSAAGVPVPVHLGWHHSRR
mmetsp:Transcript_85257/g.274559  ORF Transcript_85257/g.274559 Transcript_85257/m.274559 type:complete len:218 (-) Transcript_85257:12-665(-)